MQAFGIGLALNIRPKALLLFTAASLTITGASLSVEENLIAIIVYTVLATSTVVAPTLATVFLPDRMEPRLVAARELISAHGALMTSVVLILVGSVVARCGYQPLTDAADREPRSRKKKVSQTQPRAPGPAWPLRAR